MSKRRRGDGSAKLASPAQRPDRFKKAPNVWHASPVTCDSNKLRSTHVAKWGQLRTAS